ncbi:MAG: 2-amino-4-hydroxy-6-hydroxymethyldihydropteridine diphosphokinase [Lachnospiraceae bacterium]|nr:2-amino-4-hydroxy-6-hydroxymethyldihydropteridine diphosphokinase [Lachnospiraceae bacterium]
MDEIRIENLEVYCHHGVLKEETVLGQKFLVSLTLFTDTRQAGKSDDLSHSIDYASVAHFVEERMKGKNYKLIEAAAERLAEDILMAFPLVERLRMELKKPWAPILLPLDTVCVCIERGWQTVYLSVGSNMGDKRAHIEKAVEGLKQDEKIRRLVVSSLIETKPYGYTEQEDFLNGAIGLQTLYTPEELLDKIHEIEKEGGRERTLHWGPRTIDLDIVLYGDEVIQTDELTIPHREMHLREFVLSPLAELAPWAKHPVLGYTVSELERKVRSTAND